MSENESTGINRVQILEMLQDAGTVHRKSIYSDRAKVVISEVALGEITSKVPTMSPSTDSMSPLDSKARTTVGWAIRYREVELLALDRG